jgi:hypothetical protein
MPQPWKLHQLGTMQQLWKPHLWTPPQPWKLHQLGTMELW